MRRFASVFSSKRADKSDASSTVPPSRSATNLAVKPSKSIKRLTTLNILPVPSTPNPTNTQLLSARSEPSYSSTCSSGSTSLCTPDDDHTTLSRLPTKKSWMSWLGPKRSGTLKGSNETRPSPSSSWQAPPPPILRPPPSGNRQVQSAEDTDETTSSEDDDDESVSISHTSRMTARPSITPKTIADACDNLRVVILNHSIAPVSSLPFLPMPGSPPFPHSCNPPRFSHQQRNLSITLHNTFLLRRLERKLTSAEEVSIIPFSSRPTPTAVSSPSSSEDESAVVDPTRVSSSSEGLRRWLSRPCFEDRFVVWLPIEGSSNVTCTAVSGTNFAVAELEFSEALQAQAGLNDVVLGSVTREDINTTSDPLSEGPESSLSMTSTSSQLTAPTASRSVYKATPSPLRIEHGASSLHGSPAKPMHSQRSPDSAALASSPVPADFDNLKTTVKRGVRFADDDKADQIPIGYLLRMKKMREEKAKFLREERIRRELEIEKAKLDEERSKREQERNEWDKERRAWEREKKAIEEEKRQRLFAEEVSAARLRRESQRAGSSPSGGVSGGSGPVYTSDRSSNSSFRDTERNKTSNSKRYSRPVYDITSQFPNPRRQASEPAIPHSTSSNSSPRDASPASSRPPSGAEQSPITTPASGSQPSYSRPPSVYSSYTMSSSDDIRMREVGTGPSSGHRASMASLSSRVPDKASSYPTRSASTGYLVPPIPMIPNFAMDMPLLPPTPPFMMQQYPRPRSQISGSPSPTSSTPVQVLSSSPSSDQIHMQNRHQSGSPHRPDFRQSSSSPSSPSPGRPDYAHHRRRPSDETRPPTSRSVSDFQNRRGSHHSQHGSTSSSHSRGRRSSNVPAASFSSQTSIGPVYLQQPSPWTGLPTASQLHAHSVGLGTGRPTSTGTRRQTALS